MRILHFALLAGAVSAPGADYAQYKETLKRDPALIRFYTFEEGKGEEAANHVMLDPGRAALSGGPLGSLYILRSRSPYGTDRMYTYQRLTADSPRLDPEWTRGRLPGKAALTSGNGEVVMFRSGVDGREFKDGATFQGWFRVHETPLDKATGRLISLGDSWGGGFRVYYEKAPYFKDGALLVRIGGKELRTNFAAQPCPAGTWRHFALTVDGRAVRLYLDGELRHEQPFGAQITGYENPDRWVNWRPFFECMRQGINFLRVGGGDGKGDIVPIDFDELALYRRALSAEELKKLHFPAAGSSEEQLNEYRKLAAERAFRNKIGMKIVNENDGYFRINQTVPAEIALPADSQALTAQFTLETLEGKVLRTWKKPAEPGKVLREELRFDRCGVYYLNMELLDAAGKLIKAAPEKFGIGIVPPPPAKLNSRHKFAYWADNGDRFHYDTPVRRMSLYGTDTATFLDKIRDYQSYMPELHPYLWTTFPQAPGGKLLTIQQLNEYRKLCETVAPAAKQAGVWAFELTSEPNFHQDISGTAYAQLLPIASEVYRAAIPGVLMIPPGGSPSALPAIAAMLQAGGAQYIDGVSFHDYTSNPIGSFRWDNKADELKDIVKRYAGGKVLSIWNTECNFAVLPRVNGRPMTRKEAELWGYPVSTRHGFSALISSSPTLPEGEAAAIEVQSALMSYANSYKIYCKCGSPNSMGEGRVNYMGIPTRLGVALTALAGQVLNQVENVHSLPVASLETAALRLDNADGTHTAAVFALNPATLTFRLKPSTEYRTMDLYGNYGTIRTDGNGLLTVNAALDAQYIFNVPADFAEVAPLKLEIPAELPENGVLKGIIRLENPLKTVLKGTLSATPLPGAEIVLERAAIEIAPGTKMELGVTLKSTALKRRNYTLQVELHDKDKALAAAQQVFRSAGVIRQLPRALHPIVLDGDDSDWRNVPVFRADTADDVVHGKPNYAEQWLPQWRGPADHSAELKLAWRRHDGVYFLLDVRDDAFMPAPPERGDVFRYDCLELFFDSRSAEKLGSPLSPGAEQAMVVPGDGPSRILFARAEQDFLNIECFGKRTATGYRLEGRITPRDKSAFRALPGSRFMMDFLIDDTDKPTEMRKSAIAFDGVFSNNLSVDRWGRYELSLDTVDNKEKK